MSDDLKESSVPLGEISQGPNAFEVFLDRNQKGIAAFAILLVLGAAGLVIQRGLESNRQQDAGEALVKAGDLASLQAVVDSHQDTRAAGSAMVLLANSQWADGKKDDAIVTLRKFVAENPEHAAISSAKASLGSKLMAQGKSGDAVKVFDEIVSDPAAAYIAPFALISIGDIAKADGDLTKAESSYVKVKQDFPESNFTETATQRIATLKAKLPVEIEPPPVPATPDAAAPTEPSITLPPGTTMSPGLSVTPVTDDEPEVEIPAEGAPQEAPSAPGIEVSPEPEAPVENP
ncbi:MAG: tetratricopeptide repeat protein [Verrucomicrobiota bacterium]